MPLVSFITPAIPERASMLEECIESIARMTPVDGWQVEHLWLVDENYDGCATTTNRLARMAEGEWLVPIADDDFVLPWFLHDLTAGTPDADIVYAPPIVTGPNHGGEEQFRGQPPNIPAVALIRKSLWDALNGYTSGKPEDLIFFQHAMEQKAHFKRVDRQSWVYRFHGANDSRGYVPGNHSQ